MLRQGASLIRDSIDIFEMIQEPVQVQIKERQKPEEDAQEIAQRPLGMSEQSYAILRYCNEPQSLDELHNLTQLPMAVLQDLLCELHFNGHIEQTVQGLWLVSRAF